MAREHLDISIENLAKNPKKLPLLVMQTVTITEKVDGTKLTIIRNGQPYDADHPENNWIVAYKSNIINRQDFAGLSSKHDAVIKSSSTGISQYKFVWDGLVRAHANCRDVPRNTEFFVEFVMRKGTLTRQYENYHAMLLIAVSDTQYRIQAGKVFSTPRGFDISKLEHYANILGIQSPRVLFHGKLKDVLKQVTADGMLSDLQDRFLRVPSQFGGKMEGIVLSFSNEETYKIVQDDQYDKATRAANKAKFEPVDASSYWDKVRTHAQQHVSGLNVNDPLHQNLAKVSQAAYSKTPDLDSNRRGIQSKDDVFLTAKNMLLRKTPGNNGALFLGRFSPLTVAHHKIIEDALKTYDTVSVNIVKSKIDDKNPFPVEMQQKMLHACFGNKVEVIISSTGNLGTILQKSHHMINVVLAGSDRVEGYRTQLLHDKDVQVIEIPRTNEVSGTLVRKAMRDNDMTTFKKYTPHEVWNMWDELRGYL